MTTSEIDQQIKFHEKQIALLEMAKRAIENTISNEMDAESFRRHQWPHMVQWHVKRATSLRAVAKRVLRYYHNISVLNYEGA